MSQSVTIVGLGGSMRAASTSLTSLEIALEGAAAAGAKTQVFSIRELNLPMYTPEHTIPDAAQQLADAIAGSQAMIWSSPTYQGSISGAMKNAIDWLILLAEHQPPYLTNKPIGLMATAGGTHGLQSINAMEFCVRALRGWAVPLVLPVAHSGQIFDPEGRLTDDKVGAQLRALGAEVARAAFQFQGTGTCDYAERLQVQAH